MKRFGLVISTILLFTLCACSSKTNQTASTTPPKGTESKTHSMQQNHKPVFFNQKEVEQIKIVNGKTAKTRLLNEEAIKNIVKTMEDVGLMKKPDGSPKTLVLDSEATSAVNYDMSIYFKDGSIDNYLVWFEDDNRVTIGHKGIPAESLLEFYRIRENQKEYNLSPF